MSENIIKFTPPDIESRATISSKEINIAFNDIQNDIRKLYQDLYESRRKIAFTNDMLAMIDTILLSGEISSDIIYVHDDESVIYPSILSDREKVTIDPIYMIATLNIVDTVDQLRISDFDRGIVVLKQDINAQIQSLNNMYLDTPTKIMSSDPTDCITGQLPYIMKFQGNIDKAGTTIRISKEIDNMKINTIRIVPFPRRDSTLLEDIYLTSTGAPYHTVQYTGAEYRFSSLSESVRKQPLFIPIKTDSVPRIEFQFTTTLDVGNASTKIIGISNIDVFYNNYTSYAYIGFVVPISETYVLSDVILVGNDISQTQGIDWFVYTNFDSFDEMKEDYVMSNYDNLPVEIHDDVYILCKLNIDNDTTPVLKGIQLDLR